MSWEVHVETTPDAELCLIKYQGLKSQLSDSFRISDKSLNQRNFKSTRQPVEDEQLFVGKIVGNKVICRPLKAYYHMRPDFTHLDVVEESEVKPIFVKFAAPDKRPETEESQETYRDISCAPIKSQEAARMRQILFGARPSIKRDPDDELVDIKPKIEHMEVELSPSQTRTLVKECLFKAKIVSFGEVLEFIKENKPHPAPMKDVLDALNEFAILVQGNWAIKSEILYGDSSGKNSTDLTGISVNLFTAARDYLLWLFDQDRLVRRIEFSKKVKIPNEDVMELFSQVAVFHEGYRMWELKLATDESFLEQYPDVVQRQATFWKVRRANKLSVFGD